MRSYHLTMGAGLGGLTLREHAAPSPGPGEALVRVRAVSLNYRELMILIHGQYPLPVRPDVIAASDGAGEVVAVGEGVSAVAVGDRVTVPIFPRWRSGPFRMETSAQLGGSLDGMLTELAVLPADALVPVPPHLSFEEAAALPCAGVTAWNALTGGRPPAPGDVVLTLGSGGVSLLAIQLARALGARVVATTSSEAKAGRLRALGADEVIDYRARPDWDVEVRRLTGGRGADLVVEVGGPGTLQRSLASLAVGGEIAWVGGLAPGAFVIDLLPLNRCVGTLRRVAVGSREQFLAMNELITLRRIRPVIARVFGFDQAPAAFAEYARGGHVGKIVIAVGGGSSVPG